jgi:hypothetical protein
MLYFAQFWRFTIVITAVLEKKPRQYFIRKVGNKCMYVGSIELLTVLLWTVCRYSFDLELQCQRYKTL